MARPKREASTSPSQSAKKVKKEEPDDAVRSPSTSKAETSVASSLARWDPSVKLPDDANWPAPASDMKKAKNFIERLLPGSEDSLNITSDRPLVILPDKDADGLSSSLILHRTLIHLGLSEECIVIHHLSKGTNPASHSEVEAVKAHKPRAVILLDQGSRPGPPLLGEGDDTPVMVIDHHFLKPGEEGPQGSLMINASHSPPIATSSLLTWTICRPLWQDPAEAEKVIDWLAVLGTAGDLSVNVPWDPPWPDLAPEMKKWSKKRIGTAIALLNAPRRTPDFNVSLAYRSLLSSTTPLELLDPAQNKQARELYALRSAVSEEAERCTHTPPKFAKDGRLAVLFIDSPFQVHPGIATRWSGALRGAKNLQVVMCANKGYSPHGTHTHFSCRRAGAALKRGENPNIIELLHDYAARDPTFLSDVVKVEAELERAGSGELSTGDEEPPNVDVKTEGGDDESKAVEALNFARGHREASGGILPHALFDRFVQLMEIGVPSEKKPDSPSKKKSMPEQKTKLTSFFGVKPSGAGPDKGKAA
ncbi:hypothetical protein BCV69DRAFT_295881 [Microstroma glucosiphilum]|uniref:DDH domain-containing protein n=1 Tax=Pseudomicrostroma glucosiphilum TaxID=1684307 RepID=A0A316UEA7_9BASI|nr:hypothetical protein BCV69DRAFT_295881 [Pseudomicrostroma glucosiphilum]PWN23556.1 hypothetical protein BCV69DRAFT_295881 [Pseudomicrostroma glucosiphilum]